MYVRLQPQSSGRRRLPELPKETHDVDKVCDYLRLQEHTTYTVMILQSSSDRKKIAREMLKKAHVKGLSASFDAPSTSWVSRGFVGHQSLRPLLVAFLGGLCAIRTCTDLYVCMYCSYVALLGRYVLNMKATCKCFYM